jgi:hypothetical protein
LSRRQSRRLLTPTHRRKLRRLLPQALAPRTERGGRGPALQSETTERSRGRAIELRHPPSPREGVGDVVIDHRRVGVLAAGFRASWLRHICGTASMRATGLKAGYAAGACAEDRARGAGPRAPKGHHGPKQLCGR